MKITLISPYQAISVIGLRMISACLKETGYKTKLIFVPKTILNEKILKVREFRKSFLPIQKNKEYPKETLDRLVNLSKESDLIGISLSTNFLKDAVEITERLKKELKVPIIWGGIHPTVKPEECLEYADLVCVGEGEEAMVELAEKMEKGENYSKVRNIGLKDKNGNIILNPPRPLIQDLDSLPFQDFDLETQYIVFGGEIYHLQKEFQKKIIDFFFDAKSYRLMFTRGCPFGCAYCCNYFLNKLYSGQKIFRERSVDNVIKELKLAKENISLIEIIWLNDDNFLGLSLEKIKEFSEKYKKEINLPLGLTGINPAAVNQEKLEYLVEAGLLAIRMGIQTASEKIKKLYKRYIPNQQVEKATKIINKFKNELSTIHYDIIIDNPFEAEEDLTQTLIFLSKIPVPYELIIFSLTFYPGTELYNFAKKEGIIRDEFSDIYFKNYWEFNRNYFNNLFFLLYRYAILGKRINYYLMWILTNKFLRKIKLSLILYYILEIEITIIKFLRKITDLIKQIIGKIKNIIKKQILKYEKFI